MSFYGNWKTGTIANGAATTGEIDLDRSFEFLNVILPALTSGTVKITVSDTPGGTFQDLGSSVTTDSTTGGYSTTFRLGGYQFIKVVTSANQGAERSIKVRGFRM